MKMSFTDSFGRRWQIRMAAAALWDVELMARDVARVFDVAGYTPFTTMKIRT